ncbi:MAG: hypothetical protein M5U26_06450 [Planctomycetota bacterium]|nr:hypothetical protein [Planctomycetota bacterium]
MESISQSLQTLLHKEAQSAIQKGRLPVVLANGPSELVLLLPGKGVGAGQIVSALALAGLCLGFGYLVSLPGGWTALVSDRHGVKALITAAVLLGTWTITLGLSLYGSLAGRERIRLNGEWLRIDRGTYWLGRTIDHLPLDAPVRISVHHDPVRDRPCLQARTPETQLAFAMNLNEDQVRELGELVKTLIRICEEHLPRSDAEDEDT